MKILKIVLLLLALICVGGIIYFESTVDTFGDHVIRAYFGMPENLISNLCFTGAPLFLGAASVISLVDRIRNDKGGKVIIGIVAFLCVGMLGLIYAITGGSLGYFMHKIESPDGKHTVYYVRNKNDGDVAWLRKLDGSKYYYFRHTDTDAIESIEWMDDKLSVGGETISYDELDNK